MTSKSKSIRLALKDFEAIPQHLVPAAGAQPHVPEISISLTKLMHHMFIDTFDDGRSGDQGYMDLYGPMFVADRSLRVRGNGLGSHKEAKVGEYNRFGKAFCRWFLHDHCDITYFAHLDQLIGEPHHLGGATVTVKRIAAGNTPDYLCANDNKEFFLAEAKGTSRTVGFASAKFGTWRQQFDRVACLNAASQPISVKGYIVATRLVSESDSNTAKSTIFAEDPATRGELSLANIEDTRMRQVAVRQHYASVLERLRMPVIAEAIRTGFTIPRDYTVRVGVWECLAGVGRGEMFVGGFFAPPGASCDDLYIEGGELTFWRSSSVLCLSRPQIVFFGLEIKTFSLLKEVATAGAESVNRIHSRRFEGEAATDLSTLRDATVYGDSAYFRLVSVENL